MPKDQANELDLFYTQNNTENVYNRKRIHKYLKYFKKHVVYTSHILNYRGKSL